MNRKYAVKNGVPPDTVRLHGATGVADVVDK